MFLTFSNTILLIGLAGAVVPVVLHLLSRARYQSIDWGAMMFVEGFEARQQHSTRINQVLLLALRTAMVVMLAAALAQPVLRQWSPSADARDEAVRAADHGQLLCLGGAIACAGAMLAMVLLAMSGGRGGRRPRQVICLLLALGAGAGVVALTRRASAWETELTRLMAEQPRDAQTAGGAQGRVDAAILLDCSPSMDFEENGHSRFSLAQSAAKQVLAGLHRGDRVALMLLGQQQSDSELEPTVDLQSVADRIDAASLGHDPADVAQALVRAQEVLDRDGRSARDLYLVCDRQALSWRNVSEFFISKRWPDLLRRSNASPRIFVVPVGNTDYENVGVESIELANPPAILGQPAELEIDVRNYGQTPRSAVPLTVRVNGQIAFDTTVSVAVNRVARVAVPIRSGAFKAAGPQVVSAEIKTTGYRDDDRLDAVIEAIDPIRVLVVSGDERDEKFGDFRSESDFLRLALAPLQTLHRDGHDPCKVEVVPQDQWSAAELPHYQVVVLANIERFSDAQTRAIEQYVYGGGGLLLAPGSLSRVDNYNEQLWRGGAGILPAELQDATSSDGAEATAIVGYDPTAPVFQFLHDRPDLILSSTIGRYFPTNLRPSDAEALAWYTSGAPFLIESHAGKGKVLLLTTSLDADWSTLPLSSFYLPFVQSTVRYLSAGTLPQRNLTIGQPIQLSFDDPMEDHATVELPDGQQQAVALLRFGQVGELHFANTRDPGIYRVHVKGHAGEKALAIAVHALRDESDLTQLTDKRWAELESGLHLKRIDPTDRPIAAAVAGGREGVELWPWAIAAVLLLATIELSLARRWSRGAY